MSNSMHLTDAQYLELLKTIRKSLDTDKEVTGCDSTEIGNKYTTMSFGLCSNDYTTKENALFPESFPHQKSMKYPSKGHKCPLDKRDAKDVDGYGCFWACRYFQKGYNDKGKIKLLYDQEIIRAEKELAKSGK